MAAKVVKLASIPAALGLASIRVYAISEEKTEELLSPEELSIYAPPTQQLRYVEEQPGLLQRGFGVLRVGLQPYVRAIKGACTAVKVGAMGVYHAGQDTYNFVRDPPPGFLPRVSIITVSGLAGLILARKGSRLKRLGLPLGLATVGTAVCYPSQTVGLLKVTGKKTYAATQWTSSTVASLWRPSPAKDAIALDPEVPVPIPEPEVASAKPFPEVQLIDPALPPVDETVSRPHLEETPSLPAPEAAPVSAVPPAPAPAEDLPPVEELVLSPAPKSELAPVLESAPTCPSDAVSAEVVVAEPTPELAPEPVAEPTPELAPEPVAKPTPEPAPEPVAEPTPEPVAEPTPEPTPEPVAEPAPQMGPIPEPAPASVEEPACPEPQPEVAALTPGSPFTEATVPLLAPPAEEATPPPPAPAAETPPAPAVVEETAPPPLPLVEEAPLQPPGPAEDPSLLPLPASSSSLEPLTVISEKLGFTPDPKLMDHGQANPEDADLYSTRG